MPSADADHARRLGVALQCQAAVLSRRLLGEAATSLATELANALSLETVSIALVDDNRTRIVGRSHGDGQAPLANTALVEAVDEALDQGRRVEAPADAAAPLTVRRAHEAYARSHGVWVGSMPFEHDGRPMGAIIVTTASGMAPPEPERALIEQIGAMAAPVLVRLLEEAAPLPTRLARALRGPQRRTGGRRLGWAIGLVLLALLLIPFPDRLSADARVEGAIQRAIVAPADGYVHKALVRPGDIVQEGQPLVELVDRDLRLERRKLASELAQHENAFAGALSLADRGQMVIHRARAEEVRARIELVDHQLERAFIRAPMAAVVLTGQLDQTEGAPVSRGEVLLTLAPTDRYRLVVEVDERDASRVAAGGQGEVALTALPYDAIGFSITRILPVAEQHDGRHYIAVEGELRQVPAAVTPGMRGVARLELGHAPLLAQWTRRLRQWIGLRLWAWWGA
jgi:biotin carboxyl carrier protein